MIAIKQERNHGNFTDLNKVELKLYQNLNNCKTILNWFYFDFVAAHLLW